MSRWDEIPKLTPREAEDQPPTRIGDQPPILSGGMVEVHLPERLTDEDIQALHYADIDPDTRELIAEHYTPQAIQQRARLYVHLRETEGFTAEELRQLDAVPLNKIGPASRRLLVKRAQSAVPDESEAPDIPISVAPSPGARSIYDGQVIGPRSERDKIAAAAKDPKTSQRDKQRLRIAFIKQSLGKPKRPRRSVV